MTILETLKLAGERLRQALDNGMAHGDNMNRGLLLEASIRLTDGIEQLKKGPVLHNNLKGQVAALDATYKAMEEGGRRGEGGGKEGE